jgi:hypothetical protein
VIFRQTLDGKVINAFKIWITLVIKDKIIMLAKVITRFITTNPARW